MFKRIKKSILSLMVGGSLLSVSGLGGCTGMLADMVMNDLQNGSGNNSGDPYVVYPYPGGSEGDDPCLVNPIPGGTADSGSGSGFQPLDLDGSPFVENGNSVIKIDGYYVLPPGF